MKLLFIDTETTGLSPTRHGVIQIAGMVVIDDEVKETFNFRARPFTIDQIEDQALAVNGITREQLAEFPIPALAYQGLKEVMGRYVNSFKRDKQYDDTFVPVGHRVGFDLGFLDQFFRKNGDDYFAAYVKLNSAIDTVTLANTLRAKGIIKTKDVKLVTIAEAFGWKFNAHDAFEDVQICYRFYQEYQKLLTKSEGNMSNGASQFGIWLLEEVAKTAGDYDAFNDETCRRLISRGELEAVDKPFEKADRISYQKVRITETGRKRLAGRTQ